MDCCIHAHLCFLLVKKLLLFTAIFYMKDQLCLVLGDPSQSGKKVCFTACHLDKLKLAFTSPNVISTSPKHVLMVRIDLTIPSSKNFTGLSGKLRTKFTSPNAKSTSTSLTDMTFFAHCFITSPATVNFILLQGICCAYNELA